MKNTIKKSLSLLLAVLLLLGTCSVLAGALDLSKTYEVSWDHILTDENGSRFTWHTGLTAANNPYGYALEARERSMHDYTVKRLGLTGDNDDWTYNSDYLYAFCIEHGVSLPDKTSYKGSNNPAHGNKWEAMSDNQHKLIQLALAHGYPNEGNMQTTKDANACYAATQLIIWQISLGFRTSTTALNDKTYPMSGYSGTMTQQLLANAHLKRYYDAILTAMTNHYVRPSFTAATESGAPSYAMTYSGGQYSITLTDTNGILSQFTGVSNGGLNAGFGGNSLVVTSPTPFTGTVTIALTKRLGNAQTTGFLIWSVPGKENDNQDMLTGVDIDPVPAFVKLTAAEPVQPKGNLRINKTVSDGSSPAGFQFEVLRNGQIPVGTYTTDGTGIINIPDLAPGSYSVREINIPAGYVLEGSNSRTLSVFENETTSVTFRNIRQQGKITVRKTNTDPSLGSHSLAGAVFEILNPSGTVLYATITTNASGVAESGALALGSYIVREKTAPTGFIRNPNAYPITLSADGSSAEVIVGPEVVVPENPQPGRINIAKTNANPGMGSYSLAGAVFEIRNASGTLVDTVVTDSEGRAQTKALPLANYSVKELTAPYGFAKNSTTFTPTLVYAGQDAECAYATVSVPERPQTGIIRVNKTNSNPSMGDYALSSAVFEVRNSGGALVDTITTNSAGFAQSKELPLGAYTVTEKTAPYGYVVNTNAFPAALTYAGQDIEVVYADVTVPERPQTGTIRVTKLDKDTGAVAQGNATLNGAVFEIYAANKTSLLDTLYCGIGSAATSRELPLGTYFYKEKTPPVGYLPDAAWHEVQIAYAGQNVSVVEKFGEVRNHVILGQIALTKHTDQPMEGYDDPQIEQPLAGAVFEVYLKSAGSYAAAKATEKDRLTTNTNGYAITKKLPYGVYTVREMSAPGDVKLVAPFDVFISADGQIYRFILNDIAFVSLVKIIKTDSETGKAIPLQGTSFKVKDLSTGQWVRQHINYPTPMDLDVFETAADGTLVLPAALKSGSYELYEQRAPQGYLLGKTAITFTIHSSQATPEMIEVTVPNAPVKGIIKLEKTGDMLAGVREIETEFGTQYLPVYAPAGLKGAVFSVVAAEDIRTPDGTLRAAKGAVVDTLTTDANGKAASKQLYLGNYELQETKVPEPFLLDAEPHAVSLVYENQEVAIVSSQIGIYNARQQIEIGLQKLMERPVDAPDGFNAFKDVTFGLFADEDFKSANGAVAVPKGGLVALITVDDNGKGAVLGNLPFGKYFVQEVKTNAYYRLDSTKYPINAAYAGTDVAVAKIQVNNGGIALPNELKLGRLTILKQGEQLVGFSQDEVDGYVISQPQYELRGLPGAKFNVVAGQDFYNVYGKRVHQKGDLMDTITTGDDGRATTKPLPMGRYELVETESPAGFLLLSEPQKVVLGITGSVLTEIVSKEVSVVNQRQRARLHLQKAVERPEGAAQGFNPYADILFGLFAAEDILNPAGQVAIPAGMLLEVLRFDASGQTEMKTDLPYGKFYVQELKTATGYALDDTRHEFQFIPGDAAIVNLNINGGKPVQNKLQRGSLEILKTFEGKTTPIAGVPFTITGKTVVGTEYRGEFVTDANGKIFVENLLVGEYTVTELDSKLTAGYLLSEAQTIAVAPGEIARMTIENKLQRGGLKVVKTFEGKEVPLAGVPFMITGVPVVGGAFAGTYLTDEKGEINLRDLFVGEYTVQELGSDLTLGYMLSAQQTATVAHEKIAELKIHNKLQRGDLKIIKTFEGKDTPIAGVPFTVEGTSLAGIAYAKTFKTDKDGVILIEGLPVGQYTVRELDDKLTTGYILSKTQTAIVAADKLTELKIDNLLQRGNLKIIKTFEGRDKPLAHVPFIVDGTSQTGVKFKETFYTNDKGEIFVEGLPIGDYTIRELGSDLTAGYVLAAEQTVTIAADKTTDIAIVNKLQTGKLKIVKTFEGLDKPVAGVPFKITGKTVTGAEYAQEFKTDKNGEILVENLPVGDYVIQELESDAAKGYSLADAQTVNIKAGETTEVAIENKLNRGRVTLIKVDADHPDVKLEGAVFEVYEDTNGNGKFGRRDKLLGTMTETEPGVHAMEELPVGGYFVKEKQAPEGYVLDEKAYYFEITGAGEDAVVENVPGVGFVNANRVGHLKILKTSSDGRKEGFTFKVEGEGYSEEFVTDANGEIYIENLRLGTYTVTELETETSQGYKLPDPVSVELVADEILVVNVFNDKITITTEPLPKTGDSFVIMGVALGVLAAAGASAFFLLRRRRKEDADEMPA